MYCWSLRSVVCVLLSHGFTGGAWTANVSVGDNATLSWYLPKPTNKEFTVWNTRSGKPILSVTSYNNVTDMTLDYRIAFTGGISPSGKGLFRFVISDVKFPDEGLYACYVGPPENRGFTVGNCGQTLFVMAASTVYTRFGETTTLAWNLHGSGMEEFLVRNDFWKKTVFHITNYNLVNIFLFAFMLPGYCVQEPYIDSPEKVTVGDSVNLTCHSFLKSYPFTNLTMSFIWSRNGTRVEHDGKHKVVSDSRNSIGGQLMTSTLTISGVTKKDRAESYTCQTVVGKNLLTDLSIDNVLGVSYIPDSQSENRKVEMGDNTLFSMKTSVHQTKIYVIGPTDTPLFEMNPTAIYVREAYWTRLKIMKVITSLDTVAVQFQLSDITSSDAGRYYCSLEPRGQIDCDWEHVLAVSTREYASFSTMSIAPSDELSQSPVATVTTKKDASITKGV
ncbi:uncharacterized protein [Haliotis asinina]|uniref:uncharacterized protein n=1 Tax=Haliotis asinina TaxID=109174 RepID=UPI003532648B